MTEKRERQEILLGIDYGGTNTGIAFGINGLVQPIKVIGSKNDQTAINEIAKIVSHNKAKKIIMGLPLTFEGKETQQSLKTRHFAKLLKIRVKLPVVFVNEFQSTEDSQKAAIEQGISRKSRRTIDHLSAAVMLKTYYENDGKKD